MKKIPLLHKNTITDFLSILSETQLKIKIAEGLGFFAEDSLAVSLPAGRLIGLMARKIAEISTPEKALQKAIGLAYYQGFVDALIAKKYELLIGEKELEGRKKVLQEYFFKEKEADLAQFAANGLDESDVVQQYEAFFRITLQLAKATPKQEADILNEIKLHLERNFHRLLEMEKTAYRKLIDYLDSKMSKQDAIVFLRKQYKAKLSNLYGERVLGDSKGMTLQDIYIEPTYKLHQSCLDREQKLTFFMPRADDKGFIQLQNAPESLHQFVDGFLRNQIAHTWQIEAKQPNVLYILGFAGQGKTSFCKRLLYEILQEHPIKQDVYFVKLRNIENVRDLVKNPFKTLREELVEDLEWDIKDKLLRKSVLILDGLDELYMKDQLILDEVKQFCIKLNEQARVAKEKGLSLKIVMTSRYYLESTDLKANNGLIVQLTEFDKKKQLVWMEKYQRFHSNSQLTKEKLKSINSGNKHKHLKELLRQPILLQLVANLEQDIELDANRSTIYRRIFDELCDRSHDSAGPIDALKKLEAADLRECLQVIAFAIFQSGEEYIHKSKIEQLPILKEHFKEKLDLENALQGLMLAFYIQEVKKREGDKSNEIIEKREDYAIEFLHKSLQEYLMAEYIWEQLQELTDYDKLKRKYVISDWKEALKLLNRLFGQRMLSLEVKDYLVGIIQNDANQENKTLLADRLENFYPDFLAKDFLLVYSSDTEMFPLDIVVNTFDATWLVLMHLVLERKYARITQHKRWYYLIKCLKPKKNHRLLLMYQNLQALNLSLVDLRWADLRWADLSEANLSEANLRWADLSEANLSSADLSSADLSEANLSLADLSLADLRWANLSSADLSEANLSSANLSEADLSSANLSEANLREANLREANLREANLSEADLREADLGSADLGSADLSEANLRWANLSSANLRWANLRWANLRWANLRWAEVHIEELQTIKTFYKAKLDEDKEKTLREMHPKLFEKPKNIFESFDMSEDDNEDFEAMLKKIIEKGEK